MQQERNKNKARRAQGVTHRVFFAFGRGMRKAEDTRGRISTRVSQYADPNPIRPERNQMNASRGGVVLGEISL